MGPVNEGTCPQVCTYIHVHIQYHAMHIEIRMS